MIAGVDIGALIAGLGFFLLGMQQLEESLNDLFSRSLRRAFRRFTNNPLQGVAVGTTATAILQSSSLVTLMLLAFVGAGILSFGNALGVILGANLGTTITGWLVTTIGFKLDLHSIALPAIGIGAIGKLFLDNERRLSRYGGLILGFGLLLFGLELMKASASEFANNFDPTVVQQQAAYVFLAIGLGVTVVVQSSSAAMMVNLAALASGLISLENAASLAIGADLGTTVTVILGALKGNSAKRRVALAHFLFNLVTDVLAFMFLGPLLWLVTNGFGIKDPLFALVAFHSVFNLAGILLFFPFLSTFSRFIERRFVEKDTRVARYIDRLTLNLPEAAIDALQNETRHLFKRTVLLNAEILALQKPLFPRGFGPEALGDDSGNSHSQYKRIKELEGEMIVFMRRLQEQALGAEESGKLGQLQVAIRHAVNAAKAIKDIRHNIEAAEESEDSIGNLLDTFRQQMQEFYQGIEHLLTLIDRDSQLAELTALAKANEGLYDDMTHEIHRKDGHTLTDVRLSTALNINRELHSSNRALISGLKDLLLPDDSSRHLDELPGFG